MTLSVNFERKDLQAMFLMSSKFKLGHHSESNDYKNYRLRTVVGALGLGFVTLYYCKTIRY